ncbi:MAG TPA: heparan-alpha-glucosaminide N-acetyltransferase domain-containing protein [Bryobacteraceae bacterium]|nr:heparan-alpha-glucosaminide N-acetyltransferase domain-containing protein [Bryobacteraceae bacterium]
MKTKTSTYRLQYLDWLRGLAAVVMLQGHVFHSFLKNDLRGGGPYMLSQFLGGMPPAIFLFLTGITLAFLMDSTERKGLAPAQRLLTALRRSGYLFFLAFAFRLQLWIFGWPAPWTDLLRVDILNCMGMAMALLSAMALFRTVERARLCAVLGLAIAFASPLITQMDWSWAPGVVRNYIVPDYNFFGFFPWGAYLAFGMSAGSIIRTVPAEGIERVMQWAALLGGALILTSRYFANLPFSLYTKAEFWLNSPAQVLIKQGVTLVLVAFAFLWTRYAAGTGWSWIRQFGTTSLLVYWVHIELVYGRWLSFFKTNLTEGETAVAAACVIVLMLALSTLKSNRHRLGPVLANLGWAWGAKPEGAAGD